ncbi:hypothetical protein ACG1VR_08055 [Cedecea davisae]|uniref:hypothetical protein n=1 Tax=Cedecea davisae TaxID=158484 RepID=UPI00376EA221
MNGVINFEFIVSPILFESSKIESFVEDLIMLKNFINTGVVNIKKEKDIIGAMIDYDLFPSDKIFMGKIPKDNFPYCSNDIVRMINNILSGSTSYESDYLVEWEKPIEVSPDFDAINQDRKNELVDQFSHMAINNHFSVNKYFPFFSHSKECLQENTIEFEGEIKLIIPDQTHVVPFDFKKQLDYFTNVSKFILNLDGMNIYAEADTPLKMKMALYIGAVKLINIHKLTTRLEWEDFNVSDKFISSLKDNESFGRQKYASATYNSIINVLANTGKSEINYFYKSDCPTEARTYGNYTAYRVHINKQGRGLRFLFWSDGNEIVISNVGNKNELLIYNP